MPTWTPTCSIPFPQPSTPVRSLFPTFSSAANEKRRPDITSSITYSSSAQLQSPGTVDAYHDVDDLSLVPVKAVPLPAADRTIELEVLFDTMDDGTNHAMFNMITYNSPLVPAIMSEMSLGQNASTAAAYGPYSFVLDHLSVVDIVLKNGDTGKHPLCVPVSSSSSSLVLLLLRAR